VLNSFNIAADGYLDGSTIAIATSGYLQMFEELDRLAGWGGKKRRSVAHGRLIEADIDKALAELEKARKLAAKAIGKDAPAVVKAKDVRVTWAGYLSLDAINATMANLTDAVARHADYTDGLTKAQIAKRKKTAEKMAAIDEKIQRIQREFERREQEDELAIMLLLH
jgi:hypothetical protein